jgi:hypothetical protein
MSMGPGHVSPPNVVSQVHIQPPLRRSAAPKQLSQAHSPCDCWRRTTHGKRSRRRSNPHVDVQGRRRDGGDEMVECKTSDFVVVLFDGENEREERRGRAGLWEIGEMPNTAERGMAVRQGRRGRGWSRLGLARARWEMRLQQTCGRSCAWLCFAGVHKDRASRRLATGGREHRDRRI